MSDHPEVETVETDWIAEMEKMAPGSTSHNPFVPAYQFTGVTFYEKQDPYSETERMRSSSR